VRSTARAPPPIDRDPAKERRDRVAQPEGPEDQPDLGRSQSELRLDIAYREGDRRPIDVVRDGDIEEKSDDDPAKASLGSHDFLRLVIGLLAALLPEPYWVALQVCPNDIPVMP